MGRTGWTVAAAALLGVAALGLIGGRERRRALAAPAVSGAVLRANPSLPGRRPPAASPPRPVNGIDYDEETMIVALAGPSPAIGLPTPATDAGLYRFADAVRLVIEEWPEATLRDGGVKLSRAGRPDLHVPAIRAVYDRPDFPHRAA